MTEMPKRDQELELRELKQHLDNLFNSDQYSTIELTSLLASACLFYQNSEDFKQHRDYEVDNKRFAYFFKKFGKLAAKYESLKTK